MAVRSGYYKDLQRRVKTLIRHNKMEHIMKRAGHIYGMDYLFGSFQPTTQE